MAASLHTVGVGSRDFIFDLGVGRRAVQELGRPLIFDLGIVDVLLAEEARLVGGGEKPCPHPVRYRDLVLLLRDPLESAGEAKKLVMDGTGKVLNATLYF